MIWDCPVKGHAVVTLVDGKPRWDQADAEIHVSDELIEYANPEGMAFFKDRYDIGESCPHAERTSHARLRDG